MEHYCQEHGCKFYENQGKNGKPNWWSHKKKDGTGYCNEKINESKAPNPVEAIFPGAAKEEPKKEETFKPVRADSTCRSEALRYAVDLVVAGQIQLDQLKTQADWFFSYMTK